MLLGGNKIDLPTNDLNEMCPVCGKRLRYKSKCCTAKHPSMVCVCGYREYIIEDKADDGKLITS